MDTLSSGLMRRAIGVLAKKVVYGPLTIGLPNGDELVVHGKQRAAPEAAGARIDFRRARGAFRMAAGGAMGFSLGYVDGDWDSPDLTAMFTVFTQNEEALDSGLQDFTLASMLNRIRHLRHLTRPNTRIGSKRNIARHYDLGNEFYRLWLDDEMTYSSALFADPADPVERLEDAQRAKYRRLAEALDLSPGMHVLEIGCGWGGFAEIAAREFGCRVTAIPSRGHSTSTRAHALPAPGSTTLSKSGSRITATWAARMTGSPPSRCWRRSASATGPNICGSSRSGWRRAAVPAFR